MGKRKNKTSAHSIIQHMEDGKKVTNVLDMSQEEFESLVNQYSGGVHREQKYIPFTQEDAKKMAKEGEELISKGSVMTDGFEKAVVFLMSLTEQIWKITQKSKSFRMELFYDAETLKTNYCFFVPTGRPVSDDICPEFSSNPHQNLHR